MENFKVGDVLMVTRDWSYYKNDTMKLTAGQVVVVTKTRKGSDNFHIDKITFVDGNWFCLSDPPLFININNILKED